MLEHEDRGEQARHGVVQCADAEIDGRGRRTVGLRRLGGLPRRGGDESTLERKLSAGTLRRGAHVPEIGVSRRLLERRQTS